MEIIFQSEQRVEVIFDNGVTAKEYRDLNEVCAMIENEFLWGDAHSADVVSLETGELLFTCIDPNYTDDESAYVDDEKGFDPYEGCFTYDC